MRYILYNLVVGNGFTADFWFRNICDAGFATLLRSSVWWVILRLKVCCRCADVGSFFVFDAKHMSAMFVGCASFWHYSISKVMFLERNCRAKDRSWQILFHHTIIAIRATTAACTPSRRLLISFCARGPRFALDPSFSLVALLHTCACSTLFFPTVFFCFLYSTLFVLSLLVYSSLLYSSLLLESSSLFYTFSAFLSSPDLKYPKKIPRTLPLSVKLSSHRTPLLSSVG